MKKFLILILIILSNCTKNSFNNLNLKTKNNEKLALVIGQTGESYEIDVKIGGFNNLSLGIKTCIFSNIGGKNELIGIKDVYGTEERLLDIYINNYYKNKKYVIGKFEFENDKVSFNKKEKISYEKDLDDYDENFPDSQQIVNKPGLFKRLLGRKHYYIKTGIINYVNSKFTFCDSINESVKNDINKIKEKLEEENFSVIFSLNESLIKLQDSINFFKNVDFPEKLLYYSGHGFNKSCKEYINLKDGNELGILDPNEIKCKKITYLLDKCSVAGDEITKKMCDCAKYNNFKIRCNLVPENYNQKQVIYLKAAETCLTTSGNINHGYFTECILRENNLNFILNSECKEELEKNLKEINKIYIYLQERNNEKIITSLELQDNLQSINQMNYLLQFINSFQNLSLYQNPMQARLQ